MEFISLYMMFKIFKFKELPNHSTKLLVFQLIWFWGLNHQMNFYLNMHLKILLSNLQAKLVAVRILFNNSKVGMVKV